jgi:hypothetical protein
VAIWFQNRRARWRSKQLEQDFAELREHYDDLHARVEALKQDKLTLAAQVHHTCILHDPMIESIIHL